MYVQVHRIIGHNVLNWLHHRLVRLDAIYLSALSFKIYAQQFPIYMRAYSHLIYMSIVQ